ncbi:condensin-2 complex subunit D3-L [Culicoides brevitarsis]|uniref:condensin-2 complex subunit D3-L n=1 Tax=Culicoides brevitarsis TaxID=469753 RepID=UPI00307BA2AF
MNDDPSLNVYLGNLSRFFHDLDLAEVEELLEADLELIREKDENGSNSEDSESDEDDENPSKHVPQIYFKLAAALQNDDCGNLLQEIYNQAVCARKDAGFKEHDSWEHLVNVINKDKYLGFIYSLVHLWQLDASSRVNRKLSFNAARAYLYLLTVPGAKSCEIFDEDLIQRCFAVFNILGHMQKELILMDHEKTQILIILVSLLQDLGDIFKIVSLQGYVDLKKDLIKHLKNIIMMNHVNGYESIYFYNLTQKSYEILEILCLPLHGPVSDSIFQIFCICSSLHAHKFQNPPSRKRHFAIPVSEAPQTILQFFLYLQNKFSADTNPVLERFIKSILTNPDKNLKNEEYNHLLDVGVKYETQMYKKCNVSLVPWLETLSNSKEVIHRVNAAEFLGKLLLVDATVEWTLFENEVSQTPREVDILKILFTKIIDVNNSVKQKALSALVKAFNNGNKSVAEILVNAFSKDGENKYEAIQDEIKGLFEKLQHLLNNDLAHIRRAVILLLEILATRNSEMIDCEEFREVVMQLPDDSTILVRRQSLMILNTLLKKYPNHQGLIELWTQAFLILMKDSDTKIIELSMNSLKENVFDQIQSYENTSGNANKMPWEIIRSILKHGNRNILKNAVDEWIKSRALNQNSLSMIESHIFTPNATEAWLLLSLVAKKMKSKNPDAVIQAFIDFVQQDMYNSPVILHLNLEVISYWIPDFSRHALEKICSFLFDILKTGSSNPTLISFIYDVCYSIKKFAKSDLSWVEDIKETATQYLLCNQNKFLDFQFPVDERYLNYMLIYSDSSVQLPRPPDEKILNLFVKFVNDTAESGIIDVNYDHSMKLKVTITVLTRLAVRDVEIVAVMLDAFTKILKGSRNMAVVNNLIVCFTDLCKKHTSCVETAMQEVTNKLKSENHEIRAIALRSLRELVMQDYIKMRGRVLLNILTAIVDPYEEISNEACMVILTYVDEKNKHLLHTCFMESVFVYNGYLQYDGFDLFPVSEFDNEPSTLQGRQKIKERFSLYQFFIDNIPVTYLLMLLKNLQLVYEQLKKRKFVKCPEGVDTLQDLLHIFRQICEHKAKLETKSVNKDNPDDEEGANVNQGINAVAETKPAKGVPTMNQALAVVEKTIQVIPKFDPLVREYDSSLGIFLDRFEETLATNFKQFVEFNAFWKRFQKQSAPKKRPSKGRKRSNSVSSQMSDCESIMTDDNDDNVSIMTEDN